MNDLDQALKIFRDAIKRSSDKFDAKDIIEIEERIGELVAETPGDPTLAVEVAVYDLWPNCGAHWEHDPDPRFVI